jgi:uncharacterized protein (TIGR03437 family)
MPSKTFLCLSLFGANVAMAASSGLLLGLDYSEWADPNARQIASDGSGAAYILSDCTNSGATQSCVTKMSSDGQVIQWQKALGFPARVMAVDPNGAVYVTPSVAFETPSVNAFVEKLTADGTGVAWKAPVGFSGPLLLAVDSTGRVFVAYDPSPGDAVIVRLNTAGTIDYTTHVAGTLAALAVDPTGSEVVVGLREEPAPVISPPGCSSRFCLARLTPGDGATSYSTIDRVTDGLALAVAAAPNGDAIVYGSHYSGPTVLQRIEPTGIVRFSETLSLSPIEGLVVAVDAAGNAYVTGYDRGLMRPVRNSLAPCGSVWLGVIAPDGSSLQTTYLPGSSNTLVSTVSVVTSPDFTFLLMFNADPAFPPTQAGPFLPNPSASKLLRLSPNAKAQTVPLACAGNAATYYTGPIAPGEIVTLFGTGLGPQQGIPTEATLSKPFPTQAGNVEVTFDGKPAPLLWVQDAQINVVVPWSVAGPATQVCVSYNSAKSNCLALPVTPAAAGVFTVDGTYVAALNQDGSINSAANPAKSGSIVSIFATGLGPISPPQADGTLVGMPLPVNELPIQLLPVLDCGIFCPLPNMPPPLDVVYSGPAPFLIGGASQINFKATSGLLSLVVRAPSFAAVSNYFQVYVASQ